MNDSFDELIDTFIDNHIGISNSFLSDALALSPTANLQNLFTHGKLNLAGTGNETLATFNTLIRGDKIYWLDRKHDNITEKCFF